MLPFTKIVVTSEPTEGLVSPGFPLDACGYAVRIEATFADERLSHMKASRVVVFADDMILDPITAINSVTEAINATLRSSYRESVLRLNGQLPLHPKQDAAAA